MRAVVTRVNRARVTRAETGEVLGEIGKGFLVLLGIHVDDTEKEAAKIADRICGLRVFDPHCEPVHALGGRAVAPPRLHRRGAARDSHPAL